MNPKNPISQTQKDEIKYMLSGETENVEFEPRNTARRPKNYDFEAIVTALKNGKKYVLPIAVKTANSIYLLRKKLSAIKGLETVEFAIVKGTIGTSKTKRGKEYITAQYVLYLEE